MLTINYEEKLKQEDRNAKKYDGVYYAIVIRKFPIDNYSDRCFVFVPEIFQSFWNNIYNRYFDYPSCIVQKKYDNCDSAEQSLDTGDLVKVSFDDGNINSCNFIMAIPISSQDKMLNETFITTGTLVTDIYDGDNYPDEILNNYRNLVPLAYQITVGKEKPAPEDFRHMYYISNKGKEDSSEGNAEFRNYFLPALTTPVVSFSGSWAEKFSSIPYYSSDIHNLQKALKRALASDNLPNAFSNTYNEVVEDLGTLSFTTFSRKDTKITTKEDRALAVVLWLMGSGISIDDSSVEGLLHWAKIIFPETEEKHVKPSIVNAYSDFFCEPVSEVWRLYDGFNEYAREQMQKTYGFPAGHYWCNKIYDNIQVHINNAWLNAIVNWDSGIENLINSISDETQKEKVRRVLLMCFTICPWLAQPTLGYSPKELIQNNTSAIKKYGNANNSFKEIIDKFMINSQEGTIDNSIVFPNRNSYAEFFKEINEIIKTGDINKIINKYEETAIKYLDQPDDDYGYAAEEMCAAGTLKTKFNRLKNNLEKLYNVKIFSYEAPSKSSSSNSNSNSYTPSILTGNSNEEKIWDYLMTQIGNKYGVAGLMGNLYAESGLNSKNLQNSCEKSLGYTDDTYTRAVDNGTYKDFSGDKAGYGLAQWTSPDRKKNLLNYKNEKGTSIGNLEMQLQFLVKEMSSSYKSVWNTLKTATSVKKASDDVLLKFEIPYDRGTSVQEKRASYGQQYYNKYA